MYVCSRSKTASAINTKLGTNILYMAVARHALTRRSKGQRSRSHGYENRHGRTAASGCCDRCATAAGVGLQCTSYDCL